MVRNSARFRQDLRTSQQCLNNVEDGTRYDATEDGQIGIADLLTLVDGRRITPT